MKIAVPTMDGVTISRHFGKTRRFKIVEIENNQVVKEEIRDNDFTGHAKEQFSLDASQIHHEHHHGEDHHHSHGHDHHHAHSHEGIFTALEGVEAVLSGGMGQRLYNDFMARNVEVIITDEQNIDAAVQKFIQNDLPHIDRFCQH
jgi:predicted Fe-Mo cluster-binding NifX family protein